MAVLIQVIFGVLLKILLMDDSHKFKMNTGDKISSPFQDLKDLGWFIEIKRVQI